MKNRKIVPFASGIIFNARRHHIQDNEVLAIVNGNARKKRQRRACND